MRRLLFVGLVLLVAGCGDGRLTNSGALALCRHAIASVAINPKAVEVPYRKAFHWDGRYNFTWGREGDGVLMPNQFGALIQTEVFCTVSETTEKVIELTINGEKLLRK